MIKGITGGTIEGSKVVEGVIEGVIEGVKPSKSKVEGVKPYICTILFIHKAVRSSHFNILMIWSHGSLRLTKGPVPGGRRASSVDFPVRRSLGGGGCALLKYLPPPARSVHRQMSHAGAGARSRKIGTAFIGRGLSTGVVINPCKQASWLAFLDIETDPFTN
jgi:hypothetical protein